MIIFSKWEMAFIYTMLILMALMMMLISLDLLTAKVVSHDGPCYDRNSNKIQGLKCDVECGIISEITHTCNFNNDKEVTP
jgi:hypothetical protein